MNPMLTVMIHPLTTMSRLKIYNDVNQNMLRKHEASSSNDVNPLETIIWICDADDADRGAPMINIMIDIGGQGLVSETSGVKG